MFGLAINNHTNSWVPVIHVGDQDGVLGSWLQPAVVSALVGRWEVNQQIIAHSLSS